MKRCVVAIGTVLLPPIASAQEQHSALTPQGDAAAQIATLTWVLFGLAALVIIIVTAATLVAVRGGPQFREALASSHAIVIGGFVFPVVVLTALLIAGLHLSGVLRADAPDAFKIEVRGEQWWWRVRYPQAEGGGFESANEIRIPVGRPIVFDLTTADVIHSFWIPSLAGKMDMIPGRVTSLRLSAERPGIYRGICAEYCGGPHAWMALSVIAMPAAEFDEWLRTVDRPPQVDDIARQGERLFMRAGCGGCHTIAGTEARGTIGPSLTKLATRRMLAAGALPMSERDIARFIEHGQEIKPGNKMPPFRVFNASELNTLSAYLMALR